MVLPAREKGMKARLGNREESDGVAVAVGVAAGPTDAVAEETTARRGRLWRCSR